jgi:hypothetical protein
MEGMLIEMFNFRMFSSRFFTCQTEKISGFRNDEKAQYLHVLGANPCPRRGLYGRYLKFAAFPRNKNIVHFDFP